MQEELTQILLNDPALNALIGTRVGWSELSGADAEPPYIRLQLVGFQATYTNDGDARYDQSRVQFDVFAATYTQAKVVADRLRVLLSAYRGGSILVALLVLQRDAQEEDPGNKTRRFRRQLDFQIHHKG